MKLKNRTLKQTIIYYIKLLYLTCIHITYKLNGLNYYNQYLKVYLIKINRERSVTNG